VYVAEHALIGRQAAIKVLLPEYSGNKAVVSRFFNEAKAATAIKSHGIVEIYDFGFHHDGSAYIVMEHLDGEPLKARLDRLGVLSVAQALHITRQLAGALDAAHQKAIVHRDLKPDNVFLVPDREVAGGERIKILDFGIAKLADDSGASVAKTRTGMIMGTPNYMSPEQCRGESTIDHRADLYSLGCMLFVMLCGRPPFVASSDGGGEVLAQHILTPAPAPKSVQPSLPEPVSALVLSLLAKDPGERPQSAGELIASLDAVAQAVAGAGAAGPFGGPSPAAVPVPAAAAAVAYRPDSVAPVQTTLGGGAGAVSRIAAPPRRPVVIFAAAAVALALAGGVYALIPGGGRVDPVVAAPGAAAIVTPGEPGEPIAATTPPEPVPQMVPDAALPIIRVRIESEPAGAHVYRDDERIGLAPVDVVIAGGEERVFTLRRAGHGDATVTLPGASVAGGVARVVLERNKPAATKKSTATKKKSAASRKRRKRAGGDKAEGSEKPNRNQVLDW
jgi:serine/threonine-protein kinase